jgi:hypothetical protein
MTAAVPNPRAPPRPATDGAASFSRTGAASRRRNQPVDETVQAQVIAPCAAPFRHLACRLSIRLLPVASQATSLSLTRVEWLLPAPDLAVMLAVVSQSLAFPRLRVPGFCISRCRASGLCGGCLGPRPVVRRRRRALAPRRGIRGWSPFGPAVLGQHGGASEAPGEGRSCRALVACLTVVVRFRVSSRRQERKPYVSG